MWGVYCPDSPTQTHRVHALLDIRSPPIIGASTDGPRPLFCRDSRFQATAAVTSTGKGAASESPGAQCVGFRAPDWAGRFCSFDGRHKQWAPYEDYKIITAILTPRAPVWGAVGWGWSGAESPRWPLVSSIIWLHILATGAHPLRPNLNRILSGARRGSSAFEKGRDVQKLDVWLFRRHNGKNKENPRKDSRNFIVIPVHICTLVVRN